MRALWICLFGFAHCVSLAAQQEFPYEPAPVDNPLKGLVPYRGDKRELFPHSMEFAYLPLSELVIGEDQYDWQPLENLLNDIASRGHQTVFRVWMEYPGHQEGIPKFLEERGLKVTEWLNTNTEPFPSQKVRTPDYADDRLRQTLQKFIEVLGKRYDGDPRIAYITAGLLGTWGEWHTYPRTELMADKAVQTEVMEAYELHFSDTPILLRYPAGESSYHYAANDQRQLGYHDDSFAWATLDTGRDEDSWYFVPALKSAGIGAVSRWKTQPIGGEIRPELWGQIFDDQPVHENAQDFKMCVESTHATWLMDTGMFDRRQSDQRIANARRLVGRMGYEFHVKTASCKSSGDSTSLEIEIRNTGVAPFYHDWKFELAALSENDEILATLKTGQNPTGILPGEPGKRVFRIPDGFLPKSAAGIAIRISNPLPSGLPVRFANRKSVQLMGGWLNLQVRPAGSG